MTVASMLLPILQFGLAFAAAIFLAMQINERHTAVHATEIDVLCLSVIVLSISSAIYTVRAVRTRSQLTRQNRRLRDEAYSDALTGLGNRRSFDEALAKAWTDSIATRTTLSLILIDVDHFKSFNDLFGHPHGDRVLRQLGAVLRSSGRRATDQTFRVGGEEFAVLLPDTGLPGASKVADAIRTAIAALLIEHPGSSTGTLTVSIGVSQAIPARQLNDREQFVAAADEALYEAKRDGRNKVKVGICSPSRDTGRTGSRDVRVDGCEIILANGRRVRISTPMDTATLSSILQVVGAE